MVDIKGYEGKYAVTSCGKVWSYKTKKFLKIDKNSKGYERVHLCKNNVGKHLAIHKLVAIAYIPNPDNLPQVNHKDENKENNEVSNLEWCDERYNTNYESARQRQADKVCKAIVCIETGRVFLSQIEAGKTLTVSHRHISDCCKNQRHTCGGYHWRYASKEEAEKALERSGK